MTTWRNVTLPGGVVAQVPDDATELDFGLGTIMLHRNTADRHTTEYWKNKAAFVALRDAIADEYQEIENAFWDILQSRDVTLAQRDALAKRARLVGIAPGATNDSTRVRVQAAELINRSDGSTNAVLDMLNLFGQTWHITDYPPASFVARTEDPPTSIAAQNELGDLTAKARAAGVGGAVVMPILGTSAFRWGDDWNSKNWAHRSKA